jgi:HEAT repeat protein
VSAIPDLAGALQDSDVEVRIAALRALGTLNAHDQVGAIVLALGDADASVRANALRALPDVCPPATPALLATIENLLRDSDVSVRAQAAVALARFGETGRGLPMLDQLLRDADPNARVHALDALSEIGTGFIAAPVIQALRDTLAIVRRAACRTLAQIQPDDAIDPLVERLGDPDPAVRSAAASALRAFGEKAKPPVLSALHAEDTRVPEAALDALGVNDPDLIAPLSDYAQREIEQVRRWREIAAAIPQDSRAMTLLCEAIESRTARSELRLVKTIGLLGHRDAMDLVGKSLRSRNPDTRAAAIEALDTLGHRQLAKQITPLLDDAPAKAGLAPVEALQQLMAQADGWLRALAARAAAELNVRELVPVLHTLADDPDSLAREAARAALIQLNEVEPMETLQTVSTMERVLLLREVPLFADLPPDDLKQIADVAREEWYHDGAPICREGEDGDRMFVLVSGQVHVVKQSGQAERRLATRTVGDFIGEMAIVESAPRSATVRADGEVRTLVIEGDAFKAILRDRPEVSLAVLRGLSRRLRERD